MESLHPLPAKDSPAWTDLEEAYEALGDLLDRKPTAAAPPRPSSNKKKNGGAP
ncbi:hypothetical protein OWR29_27230 [Actinoplanes sp. Pm04-4]|uniref:Uncharacterized protein n=1 Tax=Paractinoplanes pyxinae TaxID=2997416 RepID=A0ABT4B5C9_9ACTN|nr:hypothetical protein [Actinoplanes pyxinae]MCY1141707.1 hypothetical protein [Actinoplanes pyxinae]